MEIVRIVWGGRLTSDEECHEKRASRDAVEGAEESAELDAGKVKGSHGIESDDYKRSARRRP